MQNIISSSKQLENDSQYISLTNIRAYFGTIVEHKEN